MSIVVKHKTIGEGKPLICVPVVGKDVEQIKAECIEISKVQADIVEWRIDYFMKNNSIDRLKEVMTEIRSIIKHLPVIVTYRTAFEGGEEQFDETNKVSEKQYVENAYYIIDNLVPDMIDIEISRADDDTMKKLISYAADNQIKVIGSMHDFAKTPESKFMAGIFARMSKLGADIFKIAVMPETKQDVIRLMSFSADMKETYQNPIITISMGKMGLISRIAGETDGSAVTFASVKNASAPGQIPVNEMKRLLNSLSTQKENIFLVGFMGCGKSTVARKLGRCTGLEIVDVDAEIVKKENRSIADIFEKEGEEVFRDIETKTLEEISLEGGRIVACGGGIVLKDENITIMKKYGTVILLTATPETIYKRVCTDSSRPLLNNNMTIEHIEGMLESRKIRYEKAADIIIETDDRNVDEIAAKIQEEYYI